MYIVELGCERCNCSWRINECITWLGICPNCGDVLKLDFRTVGYKGNKYGSEA